ncbi:MAG: hypothetical protein P1Q69_10940 [Candidatus Thorarchaeota archaeon]|nr:hypothetical protein [Candidatus Thorarchaeota archaeon]
MILLDPFSEVLNDLLVDMEKARLEAISAYANLQVAFRSIISDGSVLPRIEDLYGPVVSSNFRFALRMLMTLIQLLAMSVQQTSEDDVDANELPIDKLKQDFRAVVGEVEGMPDATLIGKDETSDYHSILSELVISYNIGLFTVLVFLVATMTRKELNISVGEIDQIEILLRDWTQEVMAQLTVVGAQTSRGSMSFNLSGIIPDTDDYDVVEEGLAEFNRE